MLLRLLGPQGRRVWALLVFVLACSSKRTQAGGLEVVIDADGLIAPNDFSDVRLEIGQPMDDGGSRPLWNKDYLVPEETTLPTSFAIAAGTDRDQEAFIRVTALDTSDQPVVVREALVQIPKDRVAELRLVLALKCKGKLDCPAKQSCQPDAGTCGPDRIDPSTLPTYDGGVPQGNRQLGSTTDSGVSPGVPAADGGGALRDAASEDGSEPSEDARGADATLDTNIGVTQDAGTAVDCLGASGDGGCASQICCGAIVLAGGLAPNCALSQVTSACVDACDASSATPGSSGVCAGRLAIRLCTAAADCASDPNGDTACCNFGNPPYSVNWCVAPSSAAYVGANACL